MADPYKIFVEGSDSNRNSLLIVWRELHEALRPPEGDRFWGCAIGAHKDERAFAPVAGRLYRNGTPACQHHIDLCADRPGGWPLERIPPDDFRVRPDR